MNIIINVVSWLERHWYPLQIIGGASAPTKNAFVIDFAYFSCFFFSIATVSAAPNSHAHKIIGESTCKRCVNVCVCATVAGWVNRAQIKMINSYIKRNRWILLWVLKCARIFRCCCWIIHFVFFFFHFFHSIWILKRRTTFISYQNAYQKGDQPISQRKTDCA